MEKETSTKIKGIEKVEGSSKERDVWSLVSSDKVGRSHLKSPQKDTDQVQISASKYSVLSSDDVEEGEIPSIEMEEEEEITEENEVLEVDQMEDELLAKKEKEKGKAGVQKGGKNAQKAKVQDANPTKSTRPCRRNH